MLVFPIICVVGTCHHICFENAIPLPKREGEGRSPRKPTKIDHLV